MIDLALLRSMHAEAWLAAAYAALLLAAAVGLELMARRTHTRTQRVHSGGFRYDGRRKAWVCPSGEPLTLVRVDPQRRLAAYKPSAAACARCPLLNACPESGRTRELAHSLETWPHSEVAHFHRGLSLLLVLLAAVICGLALLRHPHEGEWLVLGVCLIMIAAVADRLWPGFARRHDRLWPPPA